MDTPDFNELARQSHISAVQWSDAWLMVREEFGEHTAEVWTLVRNGVSQLGYSPESWVLAIMGARNRG